MADVKKDVIYIDVDDEITTVIDKVLSSKSDLVALVLPKRASVFQSVVNMKLLKRKADSAKKSFALVTTETSLLPLAGVTGIYVAKTLSSLPEIPEAPNVMESMILADEDEPINLGDSDEIDLSAAATEPIGKLAGIDDDEAVELDNTDKKEPEQTSKKEDRKAKKENKKKKKDLAVPNFERFRVLIFAGIAGVICLIILLYFMNNVWPSATINISTDASTVNTSVNFTLDTNAKVLNTKTSTVPSKMVSENKSATATVNATGQVNNGTKSSGSVTFVAVECSTASPTTLASGTGIVQNSLGYITTSDTSFPVIPSGKNASGCYYFNATKATSITAQNGGANYNTADNNAKFTVPGNTNITAVGGASGGTDNIQQIVTQGDITNATSKIAIDTNAVKQDLSNQLTQNNYLPITATFTTGTPTNTSTVNAGAPASTVTVTQTVTYQMYGARSSDLHALLNVSIVAQVGANQTIITDGLNNASYNTNTGPTSLTMQTTAVIGPNLDAEQIKKDAAGQKSATIQQNISNMPHVTSVTVKMSPFYVTTAPKNTNKITVNIAKPTSKFNNGTN